MRKIVFQRYTLCIIANRVRGSISICPTTRCSCL